MPPRARGGPALTLHWAAVGTGVKECLARLVTIPPPTSKLSPSTAPRAPWPPRQKSSSPSSERGPQGLVQVLISHLAQHRCPKHAPQPPTPAHQPPRLPRAGEGPGLRSLREVSAAPPWPPVAVHPGVASRTLPSPLRGVSARDRPRCNYLCLLPLWTTSVQAAEGLCSNSGRLGRTLNCLYRAGGTLRGRVPRAPLRVDF